MKNKKHNYLLVDGYNIINSWPDLIETQKISLDDAREKLIDSMAELASITGEKVILVFDSYLKKEAIRQYHYRKGIKIVFTKEFETADNYIEKVVTNANKYDTYKVASSDALIQSIIFGKGASRISAKELKFYYDNNKKILIDNTTRKTKKLSKANKDIVSIAKSSFEALEELEKKLKKK